MSAAARLPAAHLFGFQARNLSIHRILDIGSQFSAAPRDVHGIISRFCVGREWLEVKNLTWIIIELDCINIPCVADGGGGGGEARGRGECGDDGEA